MYVRNVPYSLNNSSECCRLSLIYRFYTLRVYYCTPDSAQYRHPHLFLTERFPVCAPNAFPPLYVECYTRPREGPPRRNLSAGAASPVGSQAFSQTHAIDVALTKDRSNYSRPILEKAVLIPLFSSPNLQFVRVRGLTSWTIRRTIQSKRRGLRGSFRLPRTCRNREAHCFWATRVTTYRSMYVLTAHWLFVRMNVSTSAVSLRQHTFIGDEATINSQTSESGKNIRNATG